MGKCCFVEIKSQKTKRVLWIVLWINLIVFFAQFSAAFIAHSNALLADSFDMIGDVITYAISLYALTRDDNWRTKAAFVKGIIILILASLVLFDALFKIISYEVLPVAKLMLYFSVLGLIANGICLGLLTQLRHEDINMRSVWLCARNDVVGNLSVLLAAFLVYVFAKPWPDILMGVVLAIIMYQSAIFIIRNSKFKPNDN